MNDLQEIHQDCQERFFGFAELQGELAESIVLAGNSVLRTHYRISRHHSASHLLQFTLSGQGKLQVAGGSADIVEDSVTVLPVGHPFLFELNGNHWHMVWFIVNNTQRWAHLAGMSPGVYPCRETPLVHSAAKLITEHQQLYGDQHRLTQSQLLTILVGYIDRALRPDPGVNRAQERLLKLFDRVKRQLHYPWTIQELASRLHISEPHLYRLCQQTLGQSPKQYLTELRLHHASELLKHTNIQIDQVALAVGYSDANAFSQRFKAAFGQPPLKWRQRQ